VEYSSTIKFKPKLFFAALSLRQLDMIRINMGLIWSRRRTDSYTKTSC